MNPSLHFLEVKTSYHLTTLNVTLNFDDLNKLKKLSELSESPNSTYLSITEFAFRDTTGNRIRPINQSNPLQVDDFQEDISPPTLLSYVLDLNSNMLILTFSETVNISGSLDLTQITLNNSANIDNETESYTLTGGDYVREDSNIVIVNLTRADANNIKSFLNLATGPSNTFLSFTELLVTGMEGLPIYSEELRQADEEMYIRDVSSPILESFDFDADTGKLTLHFDETVNGPELKIYKLKLIDSMQENSDISYQFQGQVLTDSIAPTVELQLDPEDILAIKTLAPLATSNDTTYLILDEDSVADTAAQPNYAIKRYLKVDYYVPDSTGPQVESIAIDLTSEEFRVNFYEPVDAQSLDMKYFCSYSRA